MRSPKIAASLLFMGIFLCCASSLHAQSYSISGAVNSANDGEAIIGAQVFINGTTLGTTTDAKGAFELLDLPTPIFELVIQSLGYKKQILTIDLSKIPSPLSVSLEEEVYDLDEITVEPNREEWAYQFHLFQRSFIGTGPFSGRTEILNPEVINFEYTVNSDINLLTGYAYKPILVKNDALGYEIEFYLEEFEIDFKTNRNFFAGQTYFKALESRRKRTLQRWEENRELAYHGSFIHFTTSLIEGHIVEEGFEVKVEQRKDGVRYISKNTLPADYFFSPLDSSSYKISYPDLLNIKYLNEYEDPSYLEFIARPFDSNPRTLTDFQSTTLHINADSLMVHRSGLVLNIKDLLFDGYWGFEKLSDMLPTNYSPQKGE